MAAKTYNFSKADTEHFSSLAEEWWDNNGAFRILHRLNPLRAAYVREQLCEHFERKAESPKPLKGLTVLDVGCGGGLLAEAMARMGARVKGLDAEPKAIAVAKKHARDSGLSITYQTGRAEDLVKSKMRFDVITAFEILEHVQDVSVFFKALAGSLKPGGMLIVATLNRTVPGFLFGVIAAERLLGWVPRGTHQWDKFMRPSVLVRRLEALGFSAVDLTGISFNPLTGDFERKKGHLSINYVLTVVKKGG